MIELINNKDNELIYLLMIKSFFKSWNHQWRSLGKNFTAKDDMVHNNEKINGKQMWMKMEGKGKEKGRKGEGKGKEKGRKREGKEGKGGKGAIFFLSRSNRCI